MLRAVRLLAAVALALGFMLLNQDFTVMFQALAEDTQRRYVGGEPVSDLLMLITLLAALASGAIMFFWPRLEPPKQQLIIRHYFVNGEECREVVHRSFWSAVRHCLLMAIARLRRVRAYLGFA
jgi:hypothetical protein